MSEITVDWEATRANVANQVSAFPALYIPRLGGTASGTVDLAPLWDRAVAARTVPNELPPEPSVDLLAEEAGGLALRLRAGLSSLAGRRDGYVTVSDEVKGEVITVTMWSDGGNWTDRAWWARTDIFVSQDEYGEVRMATPRAEFIVCSADRDFPRGENPFTDRTRFVDSHAQSCVLGGRIAAAYRAWLARGVVRGLIANTPEPDFAPVAAEDFLQTLQPTT